MNTKVIVGALLVGIVGVAGYLLFGKGESTLQDARTTKTEEVSNGPASGSLFDLARRSGSWKCVVDIAAETGAGTALSAGVVHVLDGSVRADFTTTVPGVGPMESHMIADGMNVYTWTSMMPRGFKMKMDTTETSVSGAPTSPSGEGMDANQSYAYTCEKVSVDAALFTPPSSVSFVEM
jgi:hypothetical protein